MLAVGTSKATCSCWLVRPCLQISAAQGIRKTQPLSLILTCFVLLAAVVVLIACYEIYKPAFDSAFWLLYTLNLRSEEYTEIATAWPWRVVFPISDSHSIVFTSLLSRSFLRLVHCLQLFGNRNGQGLTSAWCGAPPWRKKERKRDAGARPRAGKCAALPLPW